MKQSEIRAWLDDELAQYKGPISYADVFVICVKLQDEIERRGADELLEANNKTLSGHERLEDKSGKGHR